MKNERYISVYRKRITFGLKQWINNVGKKPFEQKVV